MLISGGSLGFLDRSKDQEPQSSAYPMSWWNDLDELLHSCLWSTNKIKHQQPLL